MPSSSSRVAAAVLLVLLLAPGARAGWWDGGVRVDVAPYREGDLLRVSDSSLHEPAKGDRESDEHDHVILFEGVRPMPDRYGIPRAAVTMRADLVGPDGRARFGERCGILEGGNETVRHETLFGDNGFGQSWRGARGGLLPVLATSARLEAHAAATFWGTCPVFVLARETFREGERVPIRDVLADADLSGWDAPGLSEPAQATTFHGRPALLLEYNLARLMPDEGVSGTYRFVVADGLPGVVRAEMDLRGEGSYRWSHELKAYRAGDGELPPFARGARLPERSPSATFVPYEPLSLDDSPFVFPYAFAEALAALRADPVTGLDAWLREHPSARLALAWYDRHSGSDGGAVGLAQRTEGLWRIGFTDGDSVRSWTTTRYSVGPDAPGLPPARRVSNGGPYVERLPWSYDEAAPPDEVADAPSIVAAAAMAGVRVEEPAFLWYALFVEGGRLNPYWAVSDISSSLPEEVGSREGRVANVAGVSAGLTNVYQTRKTTTTAGLLAPSEGGDLEAPEGGALAALAGPVPGAGLAGGVAAAGLALLLVFLKFVAVPLFTRLRRDRLLDNPVRAALYERIRAEPGIHRAQLVSAAGVGEGATRHHLSQLARHGLVVERPDGGFVRYYAAGHVPPEEARREAVLRAGSNRPVYDFFRAHPDASLRAAASQLGLSAPTVHLARRRLEKEGLLAPRGAPKRL